MEKDLAGFHSGADFLFLFYLEKRKTIGGIKPILIEKGKVK